MTRSTLLALLALPACGPSYDCGDFRLFSDTFGERCGAAGSSGSLYFEDEMVQLIIGASFEDFLTEEASIVIDYVPTVIINFRTVHLEEGVSLDTSQTAVVCGRTLGPLAGRQNWPGEASLEVIAHTPNKAQTSGDAWRFAWDATCDPQADISATGNDILELYVYETGYEVDLYGVPDDWGDP